MNDLQQEGLLSYKKWRYLKASMSLVLLSGALYTTIYLMDERRFGTHWSDYVVGILSALIVLWLLWYAIAKRYVPRVVDRRAARKTTRENLDATANQTTNDRRKRSAKQSIRFGGTMQGWLSAHVYFGFVALVLATLHSGLKFGANVHTLTYVLLFIAVASGIYGIYVYLNYPRMITDNLGKDTLEDLLLKIAELDEMARVRALSLPDEINQLVLNARENTRLGGNLFALLTGSTEENCATRNALLMVEELAPKYLRGEQPKLMRDLYLVLNRKDRILRRARRDIKLNAQLQFWMYIHTPVSVALLGALLIHIFAVLFYW